VLLTGTPGVVPEEAAGVTWKLTYLPASAETRIYVRAVAPVIATSFVPEALSALYHLNVLVPSGSLSASLYK